MARVKVCGLTNEDDLETAVDAGADALGFITDVPVDTPREVDPSTAADLVATVPPFVTSVLVLMPESPKHAAALAATVSPDVVQIHGDFDPEEFQFVRAETDAKVVPVVDAGDPERAHELEAVADAIVVDSTSDDGAGGTGETHDWEATAALARDLSTPLVLAGGLTPGNVTEAVRTVDPYAVDVASGVEAGGGVKDPEAVRAFVRNAVCPDEADTEALA